jgi:hypothetical protein
MPWAHIFHHGRVPAAEQAAHPFSGPRRRPTLSPHTRCARDHARQSPTVPSARHAGPGYAMGCDPGLAFYPGSRGSRGLQRLFSLSPDTCAAHLLCGGPLGATTLHRPCGSARETRSRLSTTRRLSPVLLFLYAGYPSLLAFGPTLASGSRSRVPSPSSHSARAQSRACARPPRSRSSERVCHPGQTFADTTA